MHLPHCARRVFSPVRSEVLKLTDIQHLLPLQQQHAPITPASRRCPMSRNVSQDILRHVTSAFNQPSFLPESSSEEGDDAAKLCEVTSLCRLGSQRCRSLKSARFDRSTITERSVRSGTALAALGAREVGSDSRSNGHLTCYLSGSSLWPTTYAAARWTSAAPTLVPSQSQCPLLWLRRLFCGRWVLRNPRLGLLQPLRSTLHPLALLR